MQHFPPDLYLSREVYTGTGERLPLEPMPFPGGEALLAVCAFCRPAALRRGLETLSRRGSGLRSPLASPGGRRRTRGPLRPATSLLCAGGAARRQVEHVFSLRDLRRARPSSRPNSTSETLTCSELSGRKHRACESGKWGPPRPKRQFYHR